MIARGAHPNLRVTATCPFCTRGFRVDYVHGVELRLRHAAPPCERLERDGVIAFLDAVHVELERRRGIAHA